MIITILKSCFKKWYPVTINYRSYKHFDEDLFRRDLKINLQNLNEEIRDYDNFKEIFMKILNQHAPTKKKLIRGNNARLMNKILSKAFMHRSKLKNNINKNPTEANKTIYNKQRYLCVSLLKKEKRKYYNNFDLNIFDDNRKFWQRIKPLFSDKQKALQNDIILVENNKIISDKEEIAEKMNTFFIEK